MKKLIPRTEEFVAVALFLAKYGEKRAGKPDLPPSELGTQAWSTAYAIFYRGLNGGRTLLTFQNSMKNARDIYDAHIETGRVGWREQSRPGASTLPPPAQMPDLHAEVLRASQQQSRLQLWEYVRGYADLDVAAIPQRVLDDLVAVDWDEGERTARTEGGARVYISKRLERDPSLRNSALRIHGPVCSACGFDFGVAYGEWGEGFAEVHHLSPLGAGNGDVRVTDPEKDLAVLCANCHRMVHRKREIVLTIEEVKRMVRSRRARD